MTKRPRLGPRQGDRGHSYQQLSITPSATTGRGGGGAAVVQPLSLQPLQPPGVHSLLGRAPCRASARCQGQLRVSKGAADKTDGDAAKHRRAAALCEVKVTLGASRGYFHTARATCWHAAAAASRAPLPARPGRPPQGDPQPGTSLCAEGAVAQICWGFGTVICGGQASPLPSAARPCRRARAVRPGRPQRPPAPPLEMAPRGSMAAGEMAADQRGSTRAADGFPLPPGGSGTAGSA